MSIRVNDLVIPDFVTTYEAETWGKQQQPESRDAVHAVYKALERFALETHDLQRKADRALTAQLIREAWQVIPCSHVAVSTCSPTPRHSEAATTQEACAV